MFGESDVYCFCFIDFNTLLLKPIMEGVEIVLTGPLPVASDAVPSAKMTIVASVLISIKIVSIKPVFQVFYGSSCVYALFCILDVATILCSHMIRPYLQLSCAELQGVPKVGIKTEG